MVIMLKTRHIHNKDDDKDNMLQDDEHNTTQERGTPQYKVRVHLPKLSKGKFDKNVRSSKKIQIDFYCWVQI